jgi:cytochrome b
MLHKVRVWDLPTRLFHWALVACVACLLITGWRGGAAIDWHARFGYAVLALLLFRIVWGFVGGRWSRFSSFLYGPKHVGAYLRGQAHPDHLVGHNPLGAGSVFAMLLVLLAQVGTGLFADDDISFTGPLNRFVASSKAAALTWYHKEVGVWIVVALVVLHIAAIAWYRWKKNENLVKPMVLGDKTLEREVPASRDSAGTRLLALVLLALAAGAVVWLVSLGTG